MISLYLDNVEIHDMLQIIEIEAFQLFMLMHIVFIGIVTCLFVSSFVCVGEAPGMLPLLPVHDAVKWLSGNVLDQ